MRAQNAERQRITRTQFIAELRLTASQLNVTGKYKIYKLLSCYVSPRDTTGILLDAAKLIVWDEAPMAHCHLFEAIEITLRYIMDCDELFGG